MEILIALAHILGSIIALLIFGFVIALIAAWEEKRNEKQAAEEFALALGVSVDDLDKEELAPRFLQLLSEKFSDELFRNRISDFCGLIRTIWSWLDNLFVIVVLLSVIGYSITDSTDNAVYAWLAVGVTIFFWSTSVIFSLICKLLTGRHPGQAKEARKFTADWVKNNSVLLERHSD